METKEYTFIDKSLWGVGPWSTEPDKIQFSDEATGLPCLIVRTPHSGHLCGYVGVAEGHPYFGKDYDHAECEVHGGLTFADFCQEKSKEHGICHIPGPGEPDRVWWLGFDCAHGGDASPARQSRELLKLYVRDSSDVYRTVAYVRGECAKLAAQLKAHIG